MYKRLQRTDFWVETTIKQNEEMIIIFFYSCKNGLKFELCIKKLQLTFHRLCSLRQQLNHRYQL